MAKKPGLKIKHVTNIIVKERLKRVWENKSIARLDSLLIAHFN